MSSIKVGINGLGRIGRYFLRLSQLDSSPIQVVAVNSRGSIQSAAHLIQYDSIHGRFHKNVSVSNSHLHMDRHSILYSQWSDPEKIEWKDVDVVLECTGVFKKKEDLTKHFQNQVKKVVIAAPVAGADWTVVYGVNHKEYQPDAHHIISNASCTTNALAPLLKVLDQSFQIQEGFMTTIHAYTNDQRLLDNAHKDLRRARAAGLSMIPTTTGATSTIEKILPHLKGKLQGISIRVPTANVSLIELTARCLQPVRVSEVHQVMEREATQSLKGILSIESAPLVSQDFIGSSYSTVLDAHLTKASQDHTVQLFSWYDNEAGFCHRLMDVIQWIQK